MMFLICIFALLAVGIASPAAPSFKPSSQPTRLPSKMPTSAPTVGSNYELFAVLNYTHCAESLPYGPSPVVDSSTAYLSTNTANKNLLHTEWIQVVTSTRSTEEYTITWTFPTAGTLEDHFVAAVTTGVTVSFRVDQGKFTYYVTNLWQFSPSAGNMTEKFAVTSSTLGFSDMWGVWGAGSVVLMDDDECAAKSCWNMGNSNYWGVGNLGSTDQIFCPNMYFAGALDSPASYPITRMYYSTNVPSAQPTVYPTGPSYSPTNTPTQPTALPSMTPTQPSALPTTEPSQPSQIPTVAPSIESTTTPTVSPTRIPTVLPTRTPVPTATPTVSPVSLLATQEVDGVTYSAYINDQANCDAVFLYTISASFGIDPSYIYNIQVTPVNRRALRTSTDMHTSASAVTLQYSAFMPTYFGLTYQDLSDRITSSVENGYFTNTMQLRASTQGVAELITASSTSVTTVNTTPGATDDDTSSNSSTHLSAGAITGIVIGSVVVVFIIVYLVFYVRKFYYKTDTSETSSGVEVSNPAHQK